MCDIAPNLFIVGMENVSTVLVDIDALDVLSVNIARNVRALVNDQHGLAVCLGLMCKDCAVQAGAYY